MTKLLDALAVEGRFARMLAGAAIWVCFGAAMVGLAATQAGLEAALHVGPAGTLAAVALVWAGWTYWHSVLFSRHRLHHLAEKVHPYRAAFFVDLVPALSVSFSQMLRPALNGSNLRAGQFLPARPETAIETVAVVAGWALLVGATALFAAAWRSLGAGRVGFVPEYVEFESFTPIRSGPYSRVRHPLFWSGIGVSLALGLICLSPLGLAVAAVNFGYGLIYNRLEDRRLQGIFGNRYGAYAHEVPRIIPRAALPGHAVRV